MQVSLFCDLQSILGLNLADMLSDFSLKIFFLLVVGLHLLVVPQTTDSILYNDSWISKRSFNPILTKPSICQCHSSGYSSCVKWHLFRSNTEFLHHLLHAVGDTLLIFEQLETCITKVELLLWTNITYVLRPLTPADFLLGRPLTSFPYVDVTYMPTNRLSAPINCPQQESFQQRAYQSWNHGVNRRGQLSTSSMDLRARHSCPFWKRWHHKSGQLKNQQCRMQAVC